MFFYHKSPRFASAAPNDICSGRGSAALWLWALWNQTSDIATDFCLHISRGELWHRLREEDFSPIDGFEEECSGPLVRLIKDMMRKNPGERPTAGEIYGHAVVSRARARMEIALAEVRATGDDRTEALFKASPLASVDDSFLRGILGEDEMEWSEF